MFLVLVLVFVFVLVLVFVFTAYLLYKFFYKKSVSSFSNISPKLKGIVYFDIDDTLSTARFDDANKAINSILDKGYGVGIVTASNRTINDVCYGNQANQQMSPWMPDALCNWMASRDYDTYNSRSLTAGKKTTFPHFGGMYEEIGRKKGWQMKHGMDLFELKDDSNVILFDDNESVIQDALQYFPHGKFVNVNNNNPQKTLTNKLVHSVIEFQG